MSFTVIIPARMHSSRLPRKPLADIAGKPMIVRVAERARQTKAARVIVATDHEEILQVCQAHGLEVILTRADHETGTDRLSEAVSTLGLSDDEVVLNIQGDEPLMPVDVANQVAQLLLDKPHCAMATAAHTLEGVEDFFNPNVVKVVLNEQKEAMTFSRAPIPWPRDHFRQTRESLPDHFPALHHLGLYSYRVGFLKTFPTLSKAPIESIESLEQLRALWHGHKIAVLELNEALPAGVDTAKDLERVRHYFK